MQELSGFDEWFGTDEWRVRGIHIETESAPGTWVDISQQYVPGSLNIGHTMPARCLEPDEIRRLIMGEITRVWRKSMGLEDDEE